MTSCAPSTPQPWRSSRRRLQRQLRSPPPRPPLRCRQRWVLLDKCFIVPPPMRLPRSTRAGRLRTAAVSGCRARGSAGGGSQGRGAVADAACSCGAREASRRCSARSREGRARAGAAGAARGLGAAGQRSCEGCRRSSGRREPRESGWPSGAGVRGDTASSRPPLACSARRQRGAEQRASAAEGLARHLLASLGEAGRMIGSYATAATDAASAAVAAIDVHLAKVPADASASRASAATASTEGRLQGCRGLRGRRRGSQRRCKTQRRRRARLPAAALPLASRALVSAAEQVRGNGVLVSCQANPLQRTSPPPAAALHVARPRQPAVHALHVSAGARGGPGRRRRGRSCGQQQRRVSRRGEGGGPWTDSSPPPAPRTPRRSQSCAGSTRLRWRRVPSSSQSGRTTRTTGRSAGGRPSA